MNTFKSQAFKLTLVLVFAAISGCKENSNTPTNSSLASNTPVIVSATNAFTYAIDANAYSTARAESGLTFTTDSVAVTLAVGGYAAGFAVLNVYDAADAVVFRDTIRTNKAVVITVAAKGIPAIFSAAYTNFTGKISFVLSRNQSTK